MRLPPLCAALVALSLGACKDAPAEPDEARRGARDSAAAAASASAAAAASASAAASVSATALRDRPFIAAMNDFCVITQEANADSKLKPAERPTAIVRRLIASSPPPAFLEFLRSLGDLEPGARYVALKKAAADRGAPSWSCPALAE